MAHNRPGESAGIAADAGSIRKRGIGATFADGGKVEDMNADLHEIGLCEIGRHTIHEQADPADRRRETRSNGAFTFA